MKDVPLALRRTATILAVSAVTLTLLAGVTGLLLAFYYEPTAGGAYRSLSMIATQVPFGWLVRRVHDLAGNLLIVVALVQMLVLFLGERFRRSWLTAWISGILLILAAIGLSWTAMILDWSQIGFWRFRVELGIIEAIPFVGAQIRSFLTGGGAISSVTITHMYTLHSYVLSLGAVGLAIAHLTGLIWQERELAAQDANKAAVKLSPEPSVPGPSLEQSEPTSDATAAI